MPRSSTICRSELECRSLPIYELELLQDVIDSLSPLSLPVLSSVLRRCVFQGTLRQDGLLQLRARMYAFNVKNKLCAREKLIVI